MPTAILIGFEYTFNSLMGAIIDLYHAYRWCESFNCDIHVLTDIKLVKDVDNLHSAIERKIVNSDIMTFYNEIKSKILIYNSRDLLMSIIRLLKSKSTDNKLFIYYSGHGVKDCMVMPDRTLLPFIDFRDNILNVIDSYVEIFWILDCCNPNGLHLPYKLNGNSFVLSSSKIECVSQPILLITSSEVNEKSIATKSGSVFSRHLFRLLTLLNTDDQPIIKRKSVIIPTHKNRNLRRLIGNLSSSIRKMHTGYAQTVSVYSSYVIDPILWMWIGSPKNYDIVIDLSLSTLIIRNFQNSSPFAQQNHFSEKNSSKTIAPNWKFPSFLDSTPHNSKISQNAFARQKISPISITGGNLTFMSNPVHFNTPTNNKQNSIISQNEILISDKIKSIEEYSLNTQNTQNTQNLISLNPMISIENNSQELNSQTSMINPYDLLYPE
jgi:hypothetical protein